MPARFSCSTTTGPTPVKSKKLMISSVTGCAGFVLPHAVAVFGPALGCQQRVALLRVVLQVRILLDQSADRLEERLQAADSRARRGSRGGWRRSSRCR